MISFKRFLKGIGILNSSDETKTLEISVADTSASGSKVTLISNATQDRTIYLPDTDGVLGLGSITVTPNRVVVSDGSGTLIASPNISSSELDALDGITGNVEGRLDSAELSIVDIQSDIADINSDIGNLVVNSIAGNETDAAPSVAATKTLPRLLPDGSVALENVILKGTLSDNLTEVDLIGVNGSDVIDIGDITKPSAINATNLSITTTNNFTVNSTGTISLSSSNITMGGNILHSVGSPVSASDAANKSYVDSETSNKYIVKRRNTGTVSQIIDHAVETEINAPTLDYDPNNLSTGTPTFTYTAPKTGVYFVDVQTRIGGSASFSVGDQVRLLTKINSNAAVPFVTQLCEVGGISIVRYVKGTAQVILNQNDVLKIVVYQNSGVNLTIADPETVISVFYLGA